MDSKILASSEAGRSNCLHYVLAPPANQENKYRDKHKKITAASARANIRKAKENKHARC